MIVHNSRQGARSQIPPNGIPQGSVISPLLFLIMINDIPRVGTKMSLFADESALFTVGRNLKILQDRAQRSLNEAQRWCDENGFKISTAKTTAVGFSHSRKTAADVEQDVVRDKRSWR